ncbi:MAG: hypothetical protein H0U74_09170, partial [Bradymonadaceae bacterium]|nr:hypothetical protein [Lujinxingiaceae bacterium]
MTLRLDSPIFNALKATLHPALIDGFAKLEGVVTRQRKVDMVVLVWTVVLGFSGGSRRTLTSLRRTYEQMAGHTLSASSFQGRLTPSFTALIRRLMLYLLDEKREAATPKLTEAIGQFRQLLALDTTILQLHAMLSKRLPSTQPNQAAAKLHVVYNVLDAKPQQIK